MDRTTVHGQDSIHCSHKQLEAPLIYVIKCDLFNWTILWITANYYIMKANERDCVREAVRAVNNTWTFLFHCMGSHSCVRIASPWWPGNDARTRHTYTPDFGLLI